MTWMKKPTNKSAKNSIDSIMICLFKPLILQFCIVILDFYAKEEKDVSVLC